MRRALTAFVIMAVALLTGCQPYSLVPSGNSQYTVINEGAKPDAQAPLSDRNEDRVERAALYFTNPDKQQLTSISRTITVRYDDTLGNCVVERLLSASSSDGLLGVVPKGTKLISFEESCSTAIINLSCEAMSAPTQDLLCMKAAIANTVISATGLKYAQILINGREQGNLLLPTGAMAFTSDTLQALWTKRTGDDAKFLNLAEGASIDRDIVVYYPARHEDYLLAEVRKVSFSNPDILGTILSELYKTPENALSVAAIDEKTSPLSAEYIKLNDGSRVARLIFPQGLYVALSENDLNAWRFFSSVCLTLCRSVPELDGVVVQVGDEWIFNASSNRKSASFNDGVMKPEDFGDAVADVASVYFSSDEGKLVSVGRVLPSKDAKSPRAIINELIRGPLPYENCQGVFPTGITTNDILGVRISDRAALINLSSGFYARCQNISFAQERNLVYSLVDTLCDMEAVDRVRIFINGKSADTLADFISIRTSLVANPGLAANG